MVIKSRITGVALTILFSCCTNNQVTNKDASNLEAPSFNNIEIHLLPAFNNSSIIKIDRLSRMVYYNVDTAMGWIKEKPAMFKSVLTVLKEIHWLSLFTYKVF